MRPKFRGAVTLAVIAALAGFLAGPALPAGNQGLVGKKAPEIEADFAVNGKPVSLADLKGKVVLLEFWAVGSSPCQSIFPYLSNWHTRFKDKDFTILAVTTYYKKWGFDKLGGKLMPVAAGLSPAEEQSMLKDFVEHYKLKYTVAALPRDEWKAVTQAYGVEKVPSAVLIDRSGVVRMVTVGAGDGSARALEEEIAKLVGQRK